MSTELSLRPSAPPPPARVLSPAPVSSAQKPPHCCDTLPWAGIVLAISIIFLIVGILGLVGSIKFHSNRLHWVATWTGIVGILGGVAFLSGSISIFVGERDGWR